MLLIQLCSFFLYFFFFFKINSSVNYFKNIVSVRKMKKLKYHVLICVCNSVFLIRDYLATPILKWLLIIEYNVSFLVKVFFLMINLKAPRFLLIYFPTYLESFGDTVWKDLMNNSYICSWHCLTGYHLKIPRVRWKIGVSLIGWPNYCLFIY